MLAATGAELVPIDTSSFRAAGDLLYDGPWVAERLTELEPWIEATRPACCRSPPRCSASARGSRPLTPSAAFTG